MFDDKRGPMYLVCVMAASLVLGVVAGIVGKPGTSKPAETSKPVSSVEEEPVVETTPEPEAPAKNQTAVLAETGTGVKITKAIDWEAEYPNQYATYMLNDENSEVVEYTEENPYIKTLYEGYGFAKSYGSARGHTYVISDLSATGRPHKLANCYTCKTSSFTAAVLNDGDSTYAMNFEDFTGQVEDAFGCFHCHGNQPGDLIVTHLYLANALGEDISKIDPADLSCGQCHSEYYFDPETKATTFGYTSMAGMNPDDMLAYENSLVDGEGLVFADWVDENTGVRKLKVQHPEFETFLGEGSPHGMETSMLKLTCADCHMGEATAEDGTTFTNHNWTSPLANQALLDANCSRCHKDLSSEVKQIQAETTARENELGEKMAQLDSDLAAAIESEAIGGDDLEACRNAIRSAQWYWDFVYVENSEGVHNPKLTTSCLDKAEQFIEEAYGYLK
jgi:nitrite reductase (cytochrome c-552)